MFQNIIIIGLGLMGGSLAKICKKQYSTSKIIAHDSHEESLKYALKNNLIDEEFNLDQKITSQSLIVVASPLKSYQEIFFKLKSIIGHDTTIIDFGSVKQKPTEIADKILAEKAKQFTPCHPIAGSEKFGIKNASENLFYQKFIHIYQDQESDVLVNFLEKIGFIVNKFAKNKEELARHDQIYSAISHLPQLISFLFAENIQTNNKKIQKHLRLQNSSKKLWQDIFAFNKNFLQKDLDKFQRYLENFLNDLRNNNQIALFSQNKKVTVLEDFDDLDMIYIFLIKSAIIENIEIESIGNIQNAILRGTGFKDFTCISIYNSYIEELFRKSPEKFNKDRVIKKIEKCILNIKSFNNSLLPI